MHDFVHFLLMREVLILTNEVTNKATSNSISNTKPTYPAPDIPTVFLYIMGGAMDVILKVLHVLVGV